MRAKTILLAGFLALTAGDAAAQQIKRTDDGHLSPKFDPVGPTVLPMPNSPEPPRSRPVLFRSPKPLSELGRYDAKASAACRSRDFGQFEQHRATVVLAGKTYGAAPSDGDFLADAKNVGAPGTLYVFEHQSTTGCRVWRLRQR